MVLTSDTKEDNMTGRIQDIVNVLIVLYHDKEVHIVIGVGYRVEEIQDILVVCL